MRKTLLFLTGIIMASLTFAEPADRQKVVMEIFTGTWCGFCPGAAMGAEDMLDNGHDVAIIKFHVGDNFANAHSNARANYYGPPGYPTTWFDGTLEHVGGSQNQSIYPTYLNLYNQRIDVPSPFTLEMEVENTNDDEYDLTVWVTNVSDFSASDLRLHVAVTETDIPFNWFNQSHVKDVMRTMVPNQNGTPLEFAEEGFIAPHDLEIVKEDMDDGDALFKWQLETEKRHAKNDSIQVELNFTLDSNWEAENMNIVAFIQDMPSKEIFQGEVIPLTTGGDDDDEDKSKNPGDKHNKNRELEGFHVFINDDHVGDNIEEMEYLFTDLPEGNHTAGVQAVYTNGESEIVTVDFTIEYQDDDDDETFHAPHDLHVTTDDMEDGEALLSWLLETDDNKGFNIKELEGFHVFVNDDHVGDNIQEMEYLFTGLPEGNHTAGVQAVYANGESEIVTVDFTIEYQDDDVSVAQPQAIQLNIFPNPARDHLFVEGDQMMHNIRMIDILGQVIYNDHVEAEAHSIDVSALKSGVYFIQVTTGSGVKSYRVQITR